MENRSPRTAYYCSEIIIITYLKMGHWRSPLGHRVTFGTFWIRGADFMPMVTTWEDDPLPAYGSKAIVTCEAFEYAPGKVDINPRRKPIKS